MRPLRKLKSVTREFSQGNLSARALDYMGNRNDEFSLLAQSFDQIAARIGQQIINQRQLIADLSHELRTPLTSLDLAIERANESIDVEKNIKRATRESHNIRSLVEGALALAWLDNEF
jgi:two-component system sensor histidine kinase PfeS